MTTAVVLILCAQVVFRYFIGTSLDWIEEVSRILLTWVTFIGAAVALKRKGHITVDYFVAFLPNTLRHYVELFTYGLIVAFSVFLGIQGVAFALLSAHTTFPALQIPVSWQYLGLPAGCLLMVAYGMAHLIAAITRPTPAES
jgi:TRAP-type C4-dicarboxylate transport system permease small subunit